MLRKAPKILKKKKLFKKTPKLNKSHKKPKIQHNHPEKKNLSVTLINCLLSQSNLLFFSY
jgi:hypothetical protein